MRKDTPQKKDLLSRTLGLKLSLCFAFCFLWASANFASPSEDSTFKGGEIAQIEKLLAQAEYERARTLTSQILKRKDLTANLRAQLYWLKAVCHISENQISLARSSLLKLLATDPFFVPAQDISPKILAIYEETYGQFKEQGGLEQTIKSSFISVDTATAGEPIPFQVKIDDPASLRKVGRIEFHVRKRGNSEFSSLDFKKPNAEATVFEVIVPPVLTQRVDDEATYEYYIDFLSHEGARIGGIGKSVLPLTFVANGRVQGSNKDGQKESKKKNFLTAALWISAATATVGGIVAAALAISAPQEGSLRIRVFPAE